MARNSGRFQFDGGAATYLGTGILAFVVTVVNFGICYPFALVLRERWRAKHTLIDGRRLVFTGSAVGLFGHWLKWLVLSVITAGIYLFWVAPRLQKWKVENTDFDPYAPVAVPSAPAAAAITASPGPAHMPGTRPQGEMER
jgi:uncharacterized membrane protein YjgN (DUF898 family)